MVKQNLIDVFFREVFFKPAEKNYDTNKTVVKQVDTWNQIYETW